MAVYTTLFSATHAELEERFPNVGDPLPAPRTVTRTDPFTKQPIQGGDSGKVADATPAAAGAGARGGWPLPGEAVRDQAMTVRGRVRA